jgi:signal transduction histidine kinase
VNALPTGAERVAGALTTLEGWLAVAAVLLGGGEPGSPWRHLWAVPVVLAALRWGLPGGTVGAIVAAMVQAPAMLLHVERFGLVTPVVEDLLAAGHVLALGPLLGALATEARRQRRRVDLLLDLQAVLADEPSAEAALGRVRARLAAWLKADVALALWEGDGWLTAGDPDLGPGSPARRAMETGRPVFVADTGDRPRPRRRLAAPLSAPGGPLGVLVVTREGEFRGGERRLVAGLAVHVGLALENVRLAARQRRFADELARRVREATARLEAMDRIKSHFVAVASHELRTPLTGLLGFSELLASRPVPADEVRRRAALMWRQARRLARIVDDLLDLSRLERGAPVEVSPVPVAVQPALQAVAELFQGAPATHEIVVDCPDELPAVRADPQALERILGNLVANAVKYAPRGTRVIIGARAGGGRVVFTVTDQGPGIAPEAVARVFEPYVRAPEAAARAPGMGLGLAVVKALVEAHGGSIALTSECGRGTRVTFELPALP